MFGQERISGKVIDNETKEPLYGVHILNFRNYAGTVTDKGGYFNIEVLPTDTLGFSIIGFENELFEIDEAHILVGELRVFMKERVYELEGITVYPWRNEKEFREHFLNLEVPDTSSYVELNLPDLPDVLPNQMESTGGVGYSFDGLFTKMYKALSKKERHRTKYLAIINKEERQKSLDKRYNKEVVSRLLGIEDEKFLTAFMDFCRLNPEFIENSMDYQFYLAIIDCFHHYNRQNGME